MQIADHCSGWRQLFDHGDLADKGQIMRAARCSGNSLNPLILGKAAEQ
jgi:hypothetical protein